MAGTWHPLDGYKGDGTRWIADHLPAGITFRAGISNNGSATMASMQILKNGPVRDPSETHSAVNMEFHQPDGDNAPGSVLGVFRAKTGSLPLSTPGGYEITGAFAAEKQ